MRSRVNWRIACVYLVCFAGPYQLHAGQSSAQKKTPETAVRVAYLVPSDRHFRSKYRTAVKHAIRNVEAWYQKELDGKTFRLSHPVVQVVRTNHPADSYSTTPVNGGDAGLWFWFNALADAFNATGAQFYDPNHRWVFYIDADTSCGQVIGAVAGVALLAANDLRGLTGRANVPACPEEPPDTAGLCRWIAKQNYVKFTLRIDPYDRDGRARWAKIIRAMRLSPNDVTFTLGNGKTAQLFASRQRIIINLYPSYTPLVLGALVILLVGLLVLAFKSNMLRDNPGSTSGPAASYPLSVGRCQMAFWFYLVIAGYLYIWL